MLTEVPTLGVYIQLIGTVVPRAAIPLLTVVRARPGPTFTVTPVCWLRLPLVAVMPIGYALSGVVSASETVNVEEPLPLRLAGLSVHVALVGQPLALRLTTPAKPFWAATVVVKITGALTVPFWEAGPGVSAKLVTFYVATALCLMTPLVPMTVRV